MAAIKPLRIDSTGNVAQAQAGEFVDITGGGTGATTAAGARTNLALVPGTDVQAYNAYLLSIAGLGAGGTLGIMVKTAANTAAMRTMTGSTRVTISNSGGTGGDPVWDLSAYSDSGAGTFLKLTRDSQGLVSGTTPVVAADITGLVNATYLAKTGDTMTAGFLTLFQDPTSAMHAVTKQYVDNNIQGLAPKPTARVATTAALPALTYANGASGVGATLTASGNGILTVDGVALVLNDLILVKDQATAFQNGLYKVTTAGTAGVPFVLTRHVDMDTAAEFTGAFIPIDNEGTLNKNSLWLNNYTSAFTVGTTAVTFVQLNGATAIIATAPLSISGNTISITFSARVVNTAGAIDLPTGIATPGTYTKLTVDTYGRVTLGATAVPSDIGAQPVDAGLTSIAALTTTGIVMASANDTFVMRVLTGSAGRLTVTPVDGSGNPVFDLASGICTPGTYNSVTVDTYGRVTSASTITTANLQDLMTNGEASSVAICRAMYISAAGSMKLATANAAGTKDVFGLVSAVTIASAAQGSFVGEGILTATTAQWDAVTGQTGGLTFNAQYWLSNTTAGAITTTAPTSGYLVPIGRALDTTRMCINFGTVIQL